MSQTAGAVLFANSTGVGSSLHPERALVVQQIRPGHRAYLHPLLAPDGVGVLTEDEPRHHAWQHGLYVGLNDVNGWGYWTEGKHSGRPTGDGGFEIVDLAGPSLDGTAGARWRVRTRYLSPAAAPVLEETQSWRFALEPGGPVGYTLDLELTLAASFGPVAFGRYDYGGLFLRMPVANQTPTHFLTSGGHRDHASAEGQRFAWAALAIPIAGRPASSPLAGLAIMDHPSNSDSQTPWRIDAQYGIGPSPCRDGAWRLEQGHSRTFRYRAAAFVGEPDAAAINRSFAQYAGA